MESKETQRGGTRECPLGLFSPALFIHPGKPGPRKIKALAKLSRVRDQIEKEKQREWDIPPQVPLCCLFAPTSIPIAPESHVKKTRPGTIGIKEWFDRRGSKSRKFRSSFILWHLRFTGSQLPTFSPLPHPTFKSGWGCWHSVCPIWASECISALPGFPVYHPIQVLVMSQNFRVRESKDPGTLDSGHVELQRPKARIPGRCQAELTQRNSLYQWTTSSKYRDVPVFHKIHINNSKAKF